MGIVSVDVSKQRKADELFPEILHGLLHEPGQTSRILTIKLGIRLAKELHLDGSRGDATLLAKTLRISLQFAKKIVASSLNGDGAELFSRQLPSNRFNNTEWAAKYEEFVFRPENARSCPGKRIILHIVDIRIYRSVIIHKIHSLVDTYIHSFIHSDHLVHSFIHSFTCFSVHQLFH